MATTASGEFHDPPMHSALSAASFRCHYCGANDISIWCRATDRNRTAGREVFTVTRCNSCGIFQTHPRLTPGELSTYYPDAYFPDPDRSAALRTSERKKVLLVQRFCSPGTLLDIGAGVGLFVHEAVDAGFNAEGIEISAQAVDAGKRSLGVRLTAGDLLDLPMSPGTYDVVTLWHVFEHLPDPRAALQKISQVLRKPGTLIIAVPNIASFQARIFRSRWFHLDVPRHLFHYSPATLEHILRDAGFEVRQTILRHREHDSAGILGSIIRLSAPDETFLHKLLRKVVGVPVAQLLAASETLAFGTGGTFVTIAQMKNDR